jgi:hypothetical protein
MSSRLAIAAIAAVAALAAARRRGSRSTQHGHQTLWVGTHRDNLPGILDHGLLPTGGWSPHRTKSAGAVFLTDSPEAALLYADASPSHEPVLLEVDAKGLELHPDTDDIQNEMASLLYELQDRTGLPYLSHGAKLTEAQAELVEDVLEEIQEEEVFDFPLTAGVSYESADPQLIVRPINSLPIDTRATRAVPELYEEMSEHEDGEPRLAAEQWQHLGPIPVHRIQAVHTLSSRPDQTWPSYGWLELDSDQIDLDDLLDGRLQAADLYELVRFRQRGFQKLSTEEARRLKPSGSRNTGGIVKQVQKALTPDLIDQSRCKPRRGASPLECHCYHAAEAVYHLAGAKKSGLVPVHGKFRGGTHWWLEDRKSGRVVDPTAAQLPSDYPYDGRRAGFLTRDPSKRARIVMQRVQEST